MKFVFDTNKALVINQNNNKCNSIDSTLQSTYVYAYNSTVWM